MGTAHRTPRRRKTLASLLVAAGLVAVVAAQAGAASSKGNPPGNNGTIKIDGVALQGGQRNEPHVDCEFAVEFFGYDEGNLTASLSFELQAPTRRPSGSQVLRTDSLNIGEDPAGGATDLDASKKYSLDFIGVSPHAQQGYHVKLTIHAQGSQGADVKHKVFWVEPCAAPPPTTATTTVTTVAPTTVNTVAPTTVNTVAPTTVTTAAPVVAGAVAEKEPAVSLAPAATELPRTGAGTMGLTMAGVAMTLSGLVLRGRPTRRPRRS